MILCKTNNNDHDDNNNTMESLMQKEAVRAHNPKPKTNDTLDAHFRILCAEMQPSGMGNEGFRDVVWGSLQ